MCRRRSWSRRIIGHQDRVIFRFTIKRLAAWRRNNIPVDPDPHACFTQNGFRRRNDMAGIHPVGRTKVKHFILVKEIHILVPVHPDSALVIHVGFTVIHRYEITAFPGHDRALSRVIAIAVRGAIREVIDGADIDPAYVLAASGGRVTVCRNRCRCRRWCVCGFRRGRWC